MTQETIRPDQLKATNSPTDGYTAVFDSGTEKFEWTLISGASQNDFVSYSVVWSTSQNPQPSIGNGVLEASYLLRDGMCYFRVWLYIGGTTSIPPSGNWRFSLPFTVDNNVPFNGYTGEAILTDTSEVDVYFLKPRIRSGTLLEYFYLPFPSGLMTNRLTSSQPIIIAGGDSLEIQIEYKISS